MGPAPLQPRQQPKLQVITSAIAGALLGSGTLHAAVGRLHDALLSLDVTPLQANSAANRLMILGQEVRGPEDLPTSLK